MVIIRSKHGSQMLAGMRLPAGHGSWKQLLAYAATQLLSSRPMKEFTYAEAHQQLAARLECARREGGVRIRRRDGQAVVLRPAVRLGAPLDGPGLDLGSRRDEIVDPVRASHRAA